MSPNPESYDSKLYALNTNGTKSWEFATRNIILSSAAMGSNGAIYFGSSDASLTR